MTNTILFLCPHGAAKSVLAAAYLRQQATKCNLPLSAQFAGTDPSAQISPAVIDALRLEGIDWSAQIPHLVTQAELDQAHHIISLGCSPDEIGSTSTPIEDWSDIPAPSQNLRAATEAIHKHVDTWLLQWRSSFKGLTS